MAEFVRTKRLTLSGKNLKGLISNLLFSNFGVVHNKHVNGFFLLQAIFVDTNNCFWYNEETIVSLRRVTKSKLRSQYCVLAELSERVMMMLIIIIRAPLTLALPIVVNRKIHRKFKFLFAKSQEIRIPCKTFAKKVWIVTYFVYRLKSKSDNLP